MNHSIRIAACATLVAAAMAGALNLAQAGPAARAPKTVEVRMTNEGGTVRYEPKDITISVGDTVKWIASGGSHNVKFWPDSVPAGAVELLRKAMADTAATLTTRRFPTEGESYSIVFAGMPKGVYKYNCSPHLARGMVGTITVQ